MGEPQQVLSLVAAALTFGVATYLLRLVRGAPAPMRPAVLALWLLTVVGLYSASTFLWAGQVEDWVLSLTRLVTVTARTVILILLIGVVAFTRRRQ
jgi:hypothetical protein